MRVGLGVGFKFKKKRSNIMNKDFVNEVFLNMQEEIEDKETSW